jgi:hypothetical protein
LAAAAACAEPVTLGGAQVATAATRASSNDSVPCPRRGRMHCGGILAAPTARRRTRQASMAASFRLLPRGGGRVEANVGVEEVYFTVFN